MSFMHVYRRWLTAGFSLCLVAATPVTAQPQPLELVENDQSIELRLGSPSTGLSKIAGTTDAPADLVITRQLYADGELVYSDDLERSRIRAESISVLDRTWLEVLEDGIYQLSVQAHTTPSLDSVYSLPLEKGGVDPWDEDFDNRVAPELDGFAEVEARISAELSTAYELHIVDGQLAGLTEIPADGLPWPIDASAFELPSESPQAFTKVMADPATYTTYPCYYIHNYTWNYPNDGLGNITGQIRWPSSTCNSSTGPPSGRPVVIFTHGVGMGHQDHTFLMTHLARNGFVTASITNSGKNQDRGQHAISYLNALHSWWTWRTRLSDEVIFIGHSRGGEGAVTAGRMLGTQPGLGVEDFDIRAVVPIAPTDGGGSNGPDSREVLNGSMIGGLMGIYSTRDGDVDGYSATSSNPNPQKTMFAIYDRAGVESSHEGLFNPNQLDKAMVYVYGAKHRDFMDDVNFSTGTVEGRNVAKAYATAMLRWKTFGDTQFKDVLDDSARPASLVGSELYTQYSSASRRRVIDNFENGGTGTSTMGGSVTDGSGIVTLLEGEMHQMIPSSPHDSRGLRITWSSSGLRRVRWYIPDVNIFPYGSQRDFSDFEYLSVRMAQVYKNIYNTPDEPQDFYLRMYSDAGWSGKVRAGAYQQIPAPDEYIKPVSTPMGIEWTDFTKSALTTVRVPLSAFRNVDLESVRYVYLYFDVPGYDTGAVVIDSLELTTD